MRFDDYRPWQLAGQDELFRSYRMQRDLTSPERSYEHLQRSVAKLARPAFLSETDRFTAQMAALIRENERAMGGAITLKRQLDQDVFRSTSQIAAKMSDIERAALPASSAIRSPMDSVAASTVELTRRWKSVDADLSGIWQAARRAMESITGLDRAWRQNLPISDVYLGLSRSSPLEQLPALRAAAIAIKLPGFDTTFLGSLHRHLEQLHESGVAAGPAMAELDSAIKERADHLPQSWVNFKGMFDLLYPLLLLLFHLWYAELSEERTSIGLKGFVESQLRATENRLTLQIQTLKPPERRETIHVVERQCYLRGDRFAKAMAVVVLYPNQIVGIYKTSGKWAYVEFFDYVNGIPKTGWTLKKYVATIELKRGHVQRPPIDPAR